MSFLFPFDFHEGDRLDGLTVIAPIVRGGHGDLYLVHEEIDRKLILKVIQKADNEGEFTGIEKCRAVSSHIPGLVPILKAGRLDDGRVYCVMPPADNLGQWPDYEPDTLANRLRKKGRFTPDEVLELAERILSTVRDLHEAGLAHCDIKPDNILFIDGEPKLTDYSLLSDLLNRPSAPAGTAGFIPPEMVGHSDNYDPRACDLYAVGKILFSAWSGMDVALFPSVPREIPLQEIGIMLPLYMKACSASPKERFRSAGEFLSAVAGARSRLHRRFRTRGWNPSGGFTWMFAAILFSVVVTALVVSAVFFLFFRPFGKVVDADPLLVTTAFDVVDANDGVNSLREALNYARFRGEQTIAFSVPGSDSVNLDEPSLITSSMRFESTNRATGNPMNIVLNRLRISGRSVTTPEGVEGGGAALYANGGSFTVSGGSYQENNDGGFGGTGGAIRLINGTLTIDGATFTENHAYSRGGAVSVENAVLTIRGATFDGNGAVGFGGAVSLQRSKALISDTVFVNNLTLANILYLWMGGAILLDESELVYEVTKDTTFTVAGNRSGAGGFIAMRENSSAEFRVDGVLNIGDGRGKDFDSFCSWDEPGNAKGDKIIRKTGCGIMTINASVDNYDDRWMLEDGVLAFAYPEGGDFDGEITISGGQLRLESPYKFNSLILRLGGRTDGPAWIDGLSKLTGGTICVDVGRAVEGTYTLAGGAEDFNGTIAIRGNADGTSSGTLSVGGSANVGGFDCTLDLNDGVLSLTVQKNPANETGE